VRVSTCVYVVFELEPLAFVAVTAIEWKPVVGLVADDSVAVVNGLVHAVAAPPSTEHVNVGAGVPVAENETLGVVSLVAGPGASVIVRTGGVPAGPTLNVTLLEPVFVAWSVAVT
jgi:hypothetical protein